MNNEQTLKMTELDNLTAAPHLQMIKAALPYIQTPEQQRFFSIFTKVSELERTLQLFNSREEGMVGICSLNEDEPATPLDMLNAMKPYGSQSEQDFIDLIVNFLKSSQIYHSYRESVIPVEEEELPGSFIPRQTTGSQSAFPKDMLNDMPKDIPKNVSDDVPDDASSRRIGTEENTNRSEPHRFPFDQFRNILPPEQQSRLETAQLLMQTFQQFS